MNANKRNDALLIIGISVMVMAVPFAVVGEWVSKPMYLIATLLSFAGMSGAVLRGIALSHGSKPLYLPWLKDLLLGLYTLAFGTAVEGLLLMSHGVEEEEILLGIPLSYPSYYFWLALVFAIFTSAYTIISWNKQHKNDNIKI